SHWRTVADGTGTPGSDQIARKAADRGSFRRAGSSGPRGPPQASSSARNDRFGTNASSCCPGHTAGRALWTNQPVSLAAAQHASCYFAGRISDADDRIHPQTATASDEGNLDGSGDRWYAVAAVRAGSTSCMSKIPPAAKVREPIWKTIQRG